MIRTSYTKLQELQLLPYQLLQVSLRPEMRFQASRSFSPVRLWPYDAMFAAESAEEEHECQTCFTGAPLAETTVMSCGHRFCNDCWSQVSVSAYLLVRSWDKRASGPGVVVKRCTIEQCLI